MMELMRELCSLPGVSGSEDVVRAFLLAKVKTISGCTWSVDRLGSLLVHKTGANRPKTRLLLAAHMDEVGLIVTCVMPEGLLKFETVGGVDPRVLLGRRVLVGEESLPGVIATKAVHLQNEEERKTSPAVEKLYIDIGAKSREDAEKWVAPGDTAVFDSEFVRFGDGFIKAKALDDRAGCAILLKLLEKELAYDCDFAFTVQEEVGLRGAGAAAFTVKPEAALVLEATTAADIPHVEETKKVCFLGRGPVLSFMDGRTVYDRGLFALAKKTAREENIPFQVKQAVAGGNDAGAIHTANGGVRTAALSLPCRYLHSPSCVIRADDADATLRLAQAVAMAIAGGADGRDE